MNWRNADAIDWVDWRVIRISFSGGGPFNLFVRKEKMTRRGRAEKKKRKENVMKSGYQKKKTAKKKHPRN